MNDQHFDPCRKRRFLLAIILQHSAGGSPVHGKYAKTKIGVLCIAQHSVFQRSSALFSSEKSLVDFLVPFSRK